MASDDTEAAVQQALAWLDVLRVAINRGDNAASLLRWIDSAEREVAAIRDGQWPPYGPGRPRKDRPVGRPYPAAEAGRGDHADSIAQQEGRDGPA